MRKAVLTTASVADRGRRDRRQLQCGSKIGRRVRLALAIPLAAGSISSAAVAQSALPASVILTPPKLDLIDENNVSIVSGKLQITVPALALGDVRFSPFSFNGPHFAKNAIADENYGHLAVCMPLPNRDVTYGGLTECSSSSGSYAPTLQAVYGQERSTYYLDTATGRYSSAAIDGSSFVDSGDGYCTWTRKDGTKIVYVAYHDSSTPLCKSNNISKIVYPNGKIISYYYYGVLSTQDGVQSPIISIATNTGYLLKYVYSGTPIYGAETSVIALNRAFEACDPAAISCSLSGSWPTATISWQDKMVSTSDNFLPLPSDYDPMRHYLFTVQDDKQRQHVFELDSYFRIVSYQPPEASSPTVQYRHCSVLATSTANGGHALQDCFGMTEWWSSSGNYYTAQLPPLMLDQVSAATRNGQVWSYSSGIGFAGSSATYSQWTHQVAEPRGKVRSGTGGATPGYEGILGPISYVSNYDGSKITFENSVPNPPISSTRPLGGGVTYTYDQDYSNGRVPRYNLLQATESPNTNSGTTGTIVRSAHYTSGCGSVYWCNKPDYVLDGNNNQTDYTYDNTHGGLLTATDPAVYSPATGTNVRPQKRYTYIQRQAWYRDSSGNTQKDPNPVWLLATESYCRSGPASGSGCSLPNDEVLTTYDYGPDSGPSNLLLRGQTITTGGQTHRVCFGHDKYGNKIWEVSPNANATGCLAY